MTAEKRRSTVVEPGKGRREGETERDERTRPEGDAYGMQKHRRAGEPLRIGGAGMSAGRERRADAEQA